MRQICVFQARHRVPQSSPDREMSRASMRRGASCIAVIVCALLMSSCVDEDPPVADEQRESALNEETESSTNALPPLDPATFLMMRPLTDAERAAQENPGGTVCRLPEEAGMDDSSPAHRPPDAWERADNAPDLRVAQLAEWLDQRPFGSMNLTAAERARYDAQWRPLTDGELERAEDPPGEPFDEARSNAHHLPADHLPLREYLDVRRRSRQARGRHLDVMALDRTGVVAGWGATTRRDDLASREQSADDADLGRDRLQSRRTVVARQRRHRHGRHVDLRPAALQRFVR